MSVRRESVLEALARLTLPDGRNLVSADMIRAVTVEGGAVRFVIEAPDAETAWDGMGRPDLGWDGNTDKSRVELRDDMG